MDTPEDTPDFSREFVIPRSVIERRMQNGEGACRGYDFLVSNDLYAALETQHRDIQAVILSGRGFPTTDSGGNWTAHPSQVLSRADSAKAVPFDCARVLAEPPQHTPERKEKVCRHIAGMLYAILQESKNTRSERFGYPYDHLTSRGSGETFIELQPADLEVFGIAVRPYGSGGNLTLQTWIERDVGSMLTEMFSKDPNFTDKRVIVSCKEDGPVTDLQLNLVNAASRQSPGQVV